MSSAITLPPAEPGAPVLAYYTSPSAPAPGLHAERQPAGLVIELNPPTLRDKMKGAAVFSAVFVLGIAMAALGVAFTFGGIDAEAATALAVVLCVFVLPGLFAACLLAIFLFRASVRIEFSPETVRMTVTGFRLHYEKLWKHDAIAAVELRWHGVRLKRTDRRGCDWITFGTRDQQREVCRLLREALGLAGNAECRMGDEAKRG
jgi:hypothetical protein